MVMYKEEKWEKQFEALKTMWSEHVDALVGAIIQIEI